MDKDFYLPLFLGLAVIVVGGLFLNDSSSITKIDFNLSESSARTTVPNLSTYSSGGCFAHAILLGGGICSTGGFSFADYICADGYRGRVSGQDRCVSYGELRAAAEQICNDHAVCPLEISPSPSF